jgi:Maltose-binding periplasmic proteins/domains
MRKHVLFSAFLLCSALRAFSWTDGELLIWISNNRGFRALGELGKKFEKEMGVPVKVETQEEITEKFQAAAQGGKGPDIFFWAHDRIGEWADAGLLKTLGNQGRFQGGLYPDVMGRCHSQQTDLGISHCTGSRLAYLQQKIRRCRTPCPTFRSSSIRQGAKGQQSKCDRNHVGLQHALLQLALPCQRRSLLL